VRSPSCDLRGFDVRGYVVKGLRSSARILSVLSLLLLFSCSLSTAADAQALPDFPLPRDSSKQCPCSRGDDSIPVSSGMLGSFLPRIPNLELGFLYYFGNQVRTGRFTADYLFPFRLGPDSVLFGEAHAEGWDFRKTTPGAANNRTDLSFGGGYRTMLSANSLLGVNGFYDASRLYNRWYSSGGVGLEYAANVAGDDAVDLNLNWYGNLFNRDVLVNAFRNKGNSFDLEAGYSHALFDHALDLRLKLVGYQFDIGDKVYGLRGGADLTTRDGVFTLRYEYGHDRIDGSYNTVGGFVNVGFQLENLLNGESPFIMPEPVFRSPRNLQRMLGLKVKRNWHQPSAVVATPSTNLHGTILIADTIPFYTDILVDRIPTSKPTMTFCWRNLTSPIPVTFYPQVKDATLVGGTLQGTLRAYTVTISSSTGCVTVTEYGDAPTTDNSVYLYSFSPGTLQFSAGGGISIDFP
jgi:hypothetical protein